MNAATPATVVIAAKAGRLGNRLFLSAYFMANALAKGYRVFNPALDEYASLFEGSAHDPFCRFPVSEKSSDPELAAQYRTVFLTLAGSIGSLAAQLELSPMRLLDIRASHDKGDKVFDLCGDDFEKALYSGHYLLVKGWKFRDEQNLLRFHSEIRRCFTPIPSIRQPAEAVIARARERGDHIIGVHIRQGDYRGWKNGVHYFETTQYAHWMKEAIQLFPEKKIVFMLAASAPMDLTCFRGLEIIHAPGSVAADLHALSLCDTLMGPPSTFSAWASYIGRIPLCMLQHHLQKIHPADFALHDRV
jgi:hypothetical protein